jgi:hypothetical protein
VRADPPRPVIAPSFLAKGEIEVHGGRHEATRIGEGFWASDVKGGKFSEYFEIRTGLVIDHIFNLFRFDLGKNYFLQSDDIADCDVRPINGSAPNPWAWVADAHYAGERIVHEIAYDNWEATVGGETLIVGVEKADPSRPALFERRDSHGLVRYFFRDWDATVPGGEYFNVPQTCAGALAQASAKADPPRPVIANTYVARTEVEVHEADHPVVFGEGAFACNFEKSKAIERYDLRPSHYHVRHELFLQRYDLQKEFFLSSEDAKDCRERATQGSMPAPWSWVANATYKGQIKHHEVVLDAWEFRAGGERLAVGVNPSNPNVPVVLERESTQSRALYHFAEFNATTPEDKYFNIPEGCPQ